MKHLRFATSSLLALTLVGAGLPTAQAKPKSGTSPDGVYQLQAEAPAARADREPFINAKKFQTFTADVAKLKEKLASAPLDKTSAEALGIKSKGAAVEISLPTPKNGKIARFQVREVSIMEPGLAARYSDIKTYRGVGIDDPSAQLALDVTPAGFHAQVISPNGWYYVSPYYFGGVDDVYASFKKKDEASSASWSCELNSKTLKQDQSIREGVAPQVGFSGGLRTYRLACAANSTYVATTGGTKASGQAAIVVVINRVSAVYESELGIRLVLVANNDAVVYPPGSVDPYSNSTAALNQNTPNLNAVIGLANYDIGHVFTTGSGGVAQLGCVCGTNKGAGTTGLPTPVGDAFNIDFVAHEMGHQFGGNHTFNGNTGNCAGGNRSAAHAYEPGSGTTIMAYAGICGASDLQPNSDAFFHSESILEILTFAANTATGGSCSVFTANTNAAPVVNAGADYTIPISTPFTLTGSATDPNGDLLTYSWEERDLGAAQNPSATTDNGTSPIFRTFSPVYSPERTFPRAADLVNNTTNLGERLPITTRTLNFRLTVRDNRSNGGATNTDDAVVSTTATAGPFLVTSPNTAISAVNGQALAVTWNVANTNVAPVNTSAVNILLSLDGGYTYPITLASNTANDGSETVTLPAGVRSTTARIKVAAAGNIYFDISNANFTIN